MLFNSEAVFRRILSRQYEFNATGIGVIMMKCPNCGTENEITSNRKFCVKCGTNLMNPDEINIEQVDFGGYHTDENKENFKIGGGTFKINDRTPQTESMFVSSDELNESYDDFGSEPFIPQLDSSRVKLPEQTETSQEVSENTPDMMNNSGYGGTTPPPYPPPQAMYPPQGVNPYMQNMYGYGQPMMQTQFVGYDANGMPMYTQVMMTPQFVGYDMNGMPMYMPVPVYPQPGMPNPQMNPNMPNPQMNPNMLNPQMNPNMPNPQMNPSMPNPQMNPSMPNPQINPNMQNFMYGNPQKQKPLETPGKGKNSSPSWSDFLEEDIKPSKTDKKTGSDDDFFNKPRRSQNMNGVSAEGLDLSRIERHNTKKQNNYMSPAPEADASMLAPNPNIGNNRYMKGTAVVNADDLQQNSVKKSRVKMRKTLEVNPDDLQQYVKKSPEVIMGKTRKTNADELQAYEHKHVEAIMDGADHAVEAMPKKKVYVDELDQIELPEQMKAKKSRPKEKTVEIPSLPDIKK